jgi:hypothetical protein
VSFGSIAVACCCCYCTSSVQYPGVLPCREHPLLGHKQSVTPQAISLPQMSKNLSFSAPNERSVLRHTPMGERCLTSFLLIQEVMLECMARGSNGTFQMKNCDIEDSTGRISYQLCSLAKICVIRVPIPHSTTL